MILENGNPQLRIQSIKVVIVSQCVAVRVQPPQDRVRKPPGPGNAVELDDPLSGLQRQETEQIDIAGQFDRSGGIGAVGHLARIRDNTVRRVGLVILEGCHRQAISAGGTEG